MVKKIVFIWALITFICPFYALSLEVNPISPAIDEMQRQVMELLEKIQALKQIEKKEEPDLLKVKNQPFLETTQMESMQQQIAELKEIISALKQTRGESNYNQSENQRRSYRVAQADAQPVETRTEVPSYIPPSSSSGSMLKIYGGTTTWAHQRTNNRTLNRNGNNFDDDGLDVGYTMDLFLEANLGENHKFIVFLEGGDGNGVNNTLGTFNPATNTSSGLYSTPNYDAKSNTGGSLRISSAYYEGLFFEEKLYLAIGKMDIHSLYEGNEVAGDETTQFMSNIFVRSTGVSFQELNNYYAPGLQLVVSPVPWLDFNVVLANSNFDDVDENGLAVLEVNFKPDFLQGGNYRFFYVFDDRDYARIGRLGTENNTGWGLSFDQRFTDSLAGFFRLSLLEDDLTANVVEGTWALGVEVGGTLWRRPDDVLGLAYGAVMVNDRVPGLPHYDDEKHLEAYYRYSVNEYIALSPNFQVVIDQPRANPSTVYIFGLRAQFDFRL